MKSWLAAVVAVLALGTAHVARWAAASEQPPDAETEPYAPSPTAAPILSLGYRELAADLYWIRFLDYFGSRHSTARGIGALVDAINAFDPRYRRIYEYGARAITIASYGVDQRAYHHAIAVLERGMAQFPDNWRMPELAGQIYTQDLKTDDPAQRRAWDEKGVRLLEAAIRKPGAPTNDAEYTAYMWTKLGQKQTAIRNLREMILLTSDVAARKRMLDRLAKLEGESSAELASELYVAQHEFVTAWLRDRPSLPPTMYVVLGPRKDLSFDLTDLATGGHDLIVNRRSTTSESAPSSP